MARFLLIHGASHGAWCWDRVVPLLSVKGHEARAIDLPAHGQDRTPASQVNSQAYLDRVLEMLESDTILVGHSYGGMTITLAAAEVPKKIRALVYLCALVPRPGQSFRDFRAEAISPELNAAQTLDRAAGTASAIPELAGDVFYNDCGPEERAFALARLTPQPVGPMFETLNFEIPQVPRHYIRCLKDRVVLPDYQRKVSSGWRNVYDMDSDHSPFLSHPKALADLLDRIARAPD